MCERTGGTWSVLLRPSRLPGGVSEPRLDEDAARAAEGVGVVAAGSPCLGHEAVVGIADDLAGWRVVLLAKEHAHRLEEDPLELLPEDAVDDKVDGAVDSHQKVGGLGQRHVDSPSMLQLSID